MIWCYKQEVEMMLMRTDPFRDVDRWAQQVLGTAARPAVMPMDAWREGDAFIVEFDLPGVNPDSVNLDVERNVLTVHAERPGPRQDGRWCPRNVRAEYSVANCSLATPSTPTRSRPATRTVCCG
jgi:HSP20 family molecular chaperone IbpA